MSVIINQFEIVLESQAEETKAETQPLRAKPVQGLTPMDIRNIIQYQAERMNRIRAH
jgi:hypothetical protein